MKVIHKQKVPKNEEDFSLDFPVGAKIVHTDIQKQNGENYTMMWYEFFDGGASPIVYKARNFRWVDTGENVIGMNWHRLTTIQFGWRVRHLYEVI